MLKEFRDFALKGNLLDMAVAFVMGAAFGKLVDAFVSGMILPAVGLITAGKDFSKLQWVIQKPEKEVLAADGSIITEAVESISIQYGHFITVAIDFFLLAMVMFFLVKGLNKMRIKNETPVTPKPTQ
ncbi:MAG: large conductance mechanosensitive channel protein MscL [Flavobacteriales bacterium]